MSDREPIQWIEIDVDFCTRTFGTGSCTAALGGTVSHKCFNTTATCNARAALDLGTLTLRYIEARPNLPKGATWYPVLESVTGSSATVNIAGASPDLAPLGKRGTLTARLSDFVDHDRLTDKYAEERRTGAAQADGIGYAPEAFGTHFGKLRARWPFYAGRPIRHCVGYLEGGEIVGIGRRHFIITDLTVDDDLTVTIEGKDILDLADDKRVQAPAAVNGNLAVEILAEDAAPFTRTLKPAGTGDLEYPASGKVCIGSELLSFTRTGDAMTFTARGLDGTAIAAHKESDTVQPTLSVHRERIDVVVARLLRDFAKVPLAFLPLAKWAAEVSRWAPTIRLTADICKPEGVAKLIGELAILGVSIWWDEWAQEVGLRMNRPPDLDAVKKYSDRDNLLSFAWEERDEDRLTTVQFHTVQRNPTGGVDDAANYARQRYIQDVGASSKQEYGDTRVKEIFCRWLNHGDDAAVQYLGQRYRQRFVRPPARASMLVDKEDEAALADVAEIWTEASQGPTGRPTRSLVQVIGREDKIAGHRVHLTAQAFPFDKGYAYVTENSRPDYLASTDAQRARGAYMCDPVTKRMSNGDEPYRMI